MLKNYSRRRNIKSLGWRKAQLDSVDDAEPKAAHHGIHIADSSVKPLLPKPDQNPTQPVHKISILLWQDKEVVMRPGMAFAVGLFLLRRIKALSATWGFP